VRPQAADIAAAPLTVTSSRFRVVDFTSLPFWVDRFGVLITKRFADQHGVQSIFDLAVLTNVRSETSKRLQRLGDNFSQ